MSNPATAADRGNAFLDTRRQSIPQTMEAKSNRQTPRVVDAAELLTMNLPARQTLLSPWLQSQSLSMIYAWRGVGKTHFTICTAYALASGGVFLGWKAATPVPVLYIDGEMPGPVIKERIARTIASADAEAPPGHFRLMTPDLQPSGVMPDLATGEGQQAIENVLGDAKVIIIDNISCLVRRGKENEADGWQPVADWALRMRATGRSVIFVHHAAKGGQQRGTSKREDLLDVVISLKRPANYQPTEGARFEIHFEKCRALFGADVKPIDAKLETSPDGRQAWTTKDCASIAGEEIVELAELGLPQADIARELSVDRSTVCRALKKAQEEGRYAPKQKAKSMRQRVAKGGSDD